MPSVALACHSNSVVHTKKLVSSIASSLIYACIKVSTLSKGILKTQKVVGLAEDMDQIVAGNQAIKLVEICYSVLLIQSSVDLNLGNSCLGRSLSQMELVQISIT